MADERIFLSEGDVYVSNTKIVLHGTTYATANITSVSRKVTPASKGCAIILAVLGGLFVLGALGSFKAAEAGGSLLAILVAGAVLAAGVLWLRSLKPTFHVVLSTAAAEKEGLSSKDQRLIDKVIAAITDAITHRG